MRQASFVTKLGSTADVRPGAPDVILASEPTLGATLRTKGRFYFLCEVARQHGTNAAADLAREVADLARQEYYYDLSAGIEVSLRKALRQANRRAAQRLRDQRGRAYRVGPDHPRCGSVPRADGVRARDVRVEAQRAKGARERRRQRPHSANAGLNPDVPLARSSRAL